MTEQEMSAQELANKNLTQVIYGLHAASLIVGVTFFVAVVINYVKRDDVRGTWLESHFTWQIRTFWFAVLWALVIGAVTFPLWLVLIGIPMTFVGFAILGIWIIYRVLRGWLALRDRRPMYV